jgi:hypothetical protein
VGVTVTVAVTVGVVAVRVTVGVVPAVRVGVACGVTVGVGAAAGRIVKLHWPLDDNVYPSLSSASTSQLNWPGGSDRVKLVVPPLTVLVMPLQ